MQVVSGPIGNERVHYEAPAGGTAPGRDGAAFSTGSMDAEPIDPVLKAAHGASLVRDHPPLRRRQWPHRPRHRRPGAGALGTERRSASTACRPRSGTSGRPITIFWKPTQKGDLDITPWLEWFLGCLDRAFDRAETTLATVLTKAASGSVIAGRRSMIDSGLSSTACWMGLKASSPRRNGRSSQRCSQDTALRDITGLVDLNILVRDEGGGRSTSYSLAEIAP